MTANFKSRLILGIIFIVSGILICVTSLRMVLGKTFMFVASESLSAGKDMRVEGMALRAMNADSDLRFANFFIGSLYRKQNRYEEAEQPLLDALKYSTHPANVLRELGSNYFSMKKYLSSLSCYEESFKIDIRPTVLPGMLYFNYGKSAFYLQMFSKAIFGMYKSLYLDFSSDLIYPVMAESFLILKQFERCLYFSNLDLLKEQQNPEKQQKYFQLFAANHSYNVGINLFNSLYKKKFLGIKGINCYVTLLYLNKEYENALQVLTIAEKQYPDNPQLALLFGRVYESMNMKEEMKKYYKKFLEINPTTSIKEDLENKIKNN